MTFINYQTEFFKQIKTMDTIKPIHISLYMVLLQHWNRNRYKNPIGITRDIIMQESKIASMATYHKCIQQLQKSGFIIYKPSYNPHNGSAIFFLPFTTKLNTVDKNIKTVQDYQLTNSKNEHLSSETCSKNEQVEKEVYIYNNKTNKNNNIYIETDVQKMNRLTTKKPTTKNQTTRPKFEIPSIEKVKLFFDEVNSTKNEAERFYNYYSSNGWLVGGKTQMKNWEAAARNWILNSPNFRARESANNNALKPNNLHVKTDKNYGEPL